MGGEKRACSIVQDIQIGYAASNPKPLKKTCTQTPDWRTKSF